MEYLAEILLSIVLGICLFGFTRTLTTRGMRIFWGVMSSLFGIAALVGGYLWFTFGNLEFLLFSALQIILFSISFFSLKTT